MIAPSLEHYLQTHPVRYEVHRHGREFTAQDVARVTHTHGINMGKVIALNCDDELVLALIPAHYYLDFDLLREELEAFDVELATEGSFRSAFPDCEPGAMPPFSDLYIPDVVPLYMSTAFPEDQAISFNAGSWSEIITMNCRDFIKLAAPRFIHNAAKPPVVEVGEQDFNARSSFGEFPFNWHQN